MFCLFEAIKTCFEVEVITDEKLTQFTIKALASLQSNETVSELTADKPVKIRSRLIQLKHILSSVA